MKFLTVMFFLLTICLAVPAFAQEMACAPGQQIETSFSTSDGKVVPYLLFLPKNYPAQGQSSTEPHAQPKFGLIFFLHGRGESHGPLALVAKWGPPMMAARGDELPYVIVSPQCPADDSWGRETQQTRLLELLDSITKNYAIDTNKIFLTGLSMGGYGSWKLAANHPQRFAAVIPICGGGDVATAAKLTDVPIWAFHGDQDPVVPVANSANMVAAIKQAGGQRIRFTRLEHFGHDVWSAAYAAPQLYQWMEEESNSRVIDD